MEKILSISLKHNFTPNTLRCYGFKVVWAEGYCVSSWQLLLNKRCDLKASIISYFTRLNDIHLVRLGYPWGSFLKRPRPLNDDETLAKNGSQTILFVKTDGCADLRILWLIEDWQSHRIASSEPLEAFCEPVSDRTATNLAEFRVPKKFLHTVANLKG